MPKIFIPTADASAKLDSIGGEASSAYADQANLGTVQQKGIAANAGIAVNMGEMLAEHGKATIGQGLKLLQESKGAFDDYAYNKNFSAASIEYSQAVSNRMAKTADENGNPTWPTLTQDIAKIGEDIKAKYGAGILSPEVGARFNENFGQLQTNYGLKSISEARQQQIGFAQASVGDTIRAQATNAMADTNPANRDMYYTAAAEAIDRGVQNGYITPEAASRAKEEARSAIYYNSLILQNEKDPLAVKAMLDSHNESDLRLNAVEAARLRSANRTKLNALEDEKKQQEAQQQRVLNSKQAYNDDELDLRITQGNADATSVQAAYDAGNISHSQYVTRMKQLETVKKQKHTWDQVSSSISNDIGKGNNLAGRYTPGQISRHYKEDVDTLGDKATIQDKANIAARYGVPVKAFQDEIESVVQTGSPDQIIAASKAWATAVEKSPSLINGLSSKAAAALNYAQRQTLVGGDKGQIAEHIQKQIFNVSPTDESVRRQRFYQEEKFLPKNINRTIRKEIIDEDNLSGDLGPLAESLLKDNYAASGDAGTAIETTKQQLSNIIGKSKVNNDDSVMILPPERMYGVSAEVLRADLNASIVGVIPEGKKPEDYNLESNHVTIQTMDPNSNQKPSYLIYTKDANGNKTYLTDKNTGVPMLWQYDKKRMEVAQTADQVTQSGAIARDVQAAEAKNLQNSGQATPIGLSYTASDASGILKIASSYIGLDEKRDKDVIARALYKCTGLRIDPSRTPWCAAFVTAILHAAGRNGGSMRAEDFMNYGKPTTTPNQGDIVVTHSMAKGSSGHVGFFVGYEMVNGVRHVKVLGGNSGNSVRIASYPESVVRGYRVPPDAADIKHESQTVPEFRPSTYMTNSSHQPRGLRNNNPGNLEQTPQMWAGEVKGTDSRFKTFATPEDGIRGMFTSIKKKVDRGVNTIASILEIYAPRSENDTDEYIRRVSKAAGYPANAPIDLNNKDLMARIIAGMISHENGKNPFSIDHIKTALQ